MVAGGRPLIGTPCWPRWLAAWKLESYRHTTCGQVQAPATLGGELHARRCGEGGGENRYSPRANAPGQPI